MSDTRKCVFIYPLSVSSHVKILEIIKVLYANEPSDNSYALCIFEMRDCHKKNRCSCKWLGLSALILNFWGW